MSIFVICQKVGVFSFTHIGQRLGFIPNWKSQLLHSKIITWLHTRNSVTGYYDLSTAISIYQSMNNKVAPRIVWNLYISL